MSSSWMVLKDNKAEMQRAINDRLVQIRILDQDRLNKALDHLNSPANLCDGTPVIKIDYLAYTASNKKYSLELMRAEGQYDDRADAVVRRVLPLIEACR